MTLGATSGRQITSDSLPPMPPAFPSKGEVHWNPYVGLFSFYSEKGHREIGLHVTQKSEEGYPYKDVSKAGIL